MADVFTTDVDFVVKTCPVCGVIYALTEDFKDRKLEYDEDWYCPNGHNLIFTDPPKKKMQRQIDQLQNDKDHFKGRMYHYMEEAEHKGYQRRGHKAAHTRMKNAISRGQCPCCGDEFEDLKAHMNSKHPDYKIKEEQ